MLQKRRDADESGALTAMVDRSAIKNALLLADRGYESYNNLAHIQEKGWNFLIRIKNGTGGIVSGLSLPDSDEFDGAFHLKLGKYMRATAHLAYWSNTQPAYTPSLAPWDRLRWCAATCP